MATILSEWHHLTEAQGDLGRVERKFITEGSLQEEIDGLTSEINENTADQKEREEERLGITNDLNKFRGDLENTRNNLGQARQTESNLTKTITTKEGQIKSIDSQIESLKANTETIWPDETEAQIKKLETKKADLKQQIVAANSEREKVRANIAVLIQKEASITKDIASTEEKLRWVEEKIAVLKNAWTSLNESMGQRSNEMGELTETINEGQHDAHEKLATYQRIAAAEARAENDRELPDNYFDEIGIFPFTTKLA